MRTAAPANEPMESRSRAFGLESLACVPDRVAQAAHHMQHQHECIAEQDKLAEPRTEESRGELEAAGVAGRREEIEGQQQGAGV